jgi:3-mercaptopropionate dioxygenase
MTTSTVHSDRTAAQPSRLGEVVAAIRAVPAEGCGSSATATLVAAALRDLRPPPSILPRDLPSGSRGGIAGHTLHVEPDGAFSLVALVCPPQCWTRVHDHVTWCVFAVLAGEPVEETFRLDAAGTALIPAGHRSCRPGTVSASAPPGDIHRLGNPGAETAISLHVYGTDISRIGSSARRIYDLPLRVHAPRGGGR